MFGNFGPTSGRFQLINFFLSSEELALQTADESNEVHSHASAQSICTCTAGVSHLCSAAHSRPCTALCPPIRLACLHHVYVAACAIFWLKSASTVLRACCHFFGLAVQERSRCRRLKLWKTASSDCQSDSLFNRHASFLNQRLF